MNTKNVRAVLPVLAFGLIFSGAMAADAPIYGSQLMTNQERIQHQNKLRAATTDQEREQIRLEHHEQMKLRAKEQGLTLPETPPAQGGGMGRGMGPGGGMGGGMSPGGDMGGARGGN